MARKRGRQLKVRIDAELDDQAQKYADEHGVSLSAIIRAFLRVLTDPNDPRSLPPGTEEEEKRNAGPGRPRKKKPADLPADETPPPDKPTE